MLFTSSSVLPGSLGFPPLGGFPLGRVQQNVTRPRGLPTRLVGGSLVDQGFLLSRQGDAQVSVHAHLAVLAWPSHARIVVKKILAVNYRPIFVVKKLLGLCTHDQTL
jgi:hypothetical protein